MPRKQHITTFEDIPTASGEDDLRRKALLEEDAQDWGKKELIRVHTAVSGTPQHYDDVKLAVESCQKHYGELAQQPTMNKQLQKCIIAVNLQKKLL